MTQAFSKIKALVATLHNWPLVAADKLGWVTQPLYRTRGGLRFVCRGATNDVNQFVAVVSGFEYPLELLRVPSGALVMDCGAHIGGFALAAWKTNHERARIIAVEASPENYEMLRRNIQLNGASGIEALHAAVVGHDGTVRLSTSGNPNAYHVDVSGQEVSGRSLSSICARQHIEHVELLKLDIEGAEYEVVDADYNLLTSRVRRLILEYHLVPGRSPETLLKRVEADFDITLLHCSRRDGVVHCTNKRL